MNSIAQFEPVRGVSNLMILRKGNARMGAIRLRNGKACVVSPLSGMHGAEPPQPVSHLLAPNHYHNKALARFSEQYPRAHRVATKGATRRLEERTGLSFKSLTGLRKLLPAGYELIEPEGLKTGEVWIRFPFGDQTGWFVVDAYCGKKMTSALKQCTQPELLGTFKSYGVSCVDSYRNWTLAQIDADQPRLIIPCHGCVISDTKLPAKLSKLIERL